MIKVLAGKICICKRMKGIFHPELFSWVFYKVLCFVGGCLSSCTRSENQTKQVKEDQTSPDGFQVRSLVICTIPPLWK